MQIHGTIKSNIPVACTDVPSLVFLSLIFMLFPSYQFIPATTISFPVFYHLGIMIYLCLASI